MGIAKTNGQLQLLQDVIRQERLVLSGLRMAELGNQYFRDDVLGTEVSAKLVFEAMGVDHTSFDLNGKDGAITGDLSKPFEGGLHSQFDLVTNFGTSEHVEDSQYWCWGNIHSLCEYDGYMIHAIPEIGSWPRHGKWHYDMDRVLRLANACEYEVIAEARHEHTHDDGRPQHSLLLCFQKKRKCFPGPPFPGKTEFDVIMFPANKPHY